MPASSPTRATTMSQFDQRSRRAAGHSSSVLQLTMSALIPSPPGCHPCTSESNVGLVAVLAGILVEVRAPHGSRGISCGR